MTASTERPWPISSVGEQFELQLGKMLDAARNVGEPKRYLGNRSVQWGRIDLSAASTVPLTLRDQARFRLKMNDLLVCEGGEVGRAAIWREQLHECYYQKALHRLRPKSDYDPRIMLALLEYWSSTNGFLNFVTQTSIAHLPRDKFITMPLPLISAKEQERIGDLLDDVNGLTSTIERLISKKQSIKQGMAQQLLTGAIRLPGFADPWSEVAVGALGKTYGGLSGKSGSDFVGGNSIFVTFMDVMSNVRIDGTRTAQVRVDAAERQNLVLVDDVLFNGSSETPEELALASAVVSIRPNTYLNSFCFGFRAHSKGVIDPRFFAYLFRGAPGRSRLTALAQGATRYNLSKSQFRRISIQLPSSCEQSAIASALGASDSEIDKLRVKLKKARAIKQGMMQELLTGRTRLPSEEHPA